ncbi:heterokaryon incompatibility protein-domain-containing protein [Podospora didyma]|uniref:Heterokaryon incompatibility protein-domain-containing protein n=1 Tax=Podospora didyma TaxID=330526 RepID=A0AAE0NZN3_9PEZI|nr:heterokaryon incompatibility protein-domain-containing protein [Podospora didyma]
MARNQAPTKDQSQNLTIRQSQRDGEGVCDLCRELIQYILSPPHHPAFNHYDNFSEMEASAERCPSCHFFLSCFDPGPIHPESKVVCCITNSTSAVVVTSNETAKVGRSFIWNSLLGHVGNRAIWKETKPLTLESSLPVIWEWRDACASTHEECNVSFHHGAAGLPTRLIYVGSGIESPCRLVATSSPMPKEWTDLRYAALSHCWGHVSNRTKSLKSNLGDFMIEIEAEKLSRTFADAITVTKMLGLRFLWIDCLCIVQDDELDWQREAAKMASVFSNAELTIAATASRNSDQGFLFPRAPAVHATIPGTADYADTSEGAVGKGVAFRFETDVRRALSDSVLLQRGWVLQEMTLSRRILHFAQNQLFWCCRSRMASEDGTLDCRNLGNFYSIPSLVPNKYPSLEEARKCWWGWVEKYNSLEFTKEADRIAALAGLTEAFTWGGKPLLGLWEKDILRGLTWRTDEKEASRRALPGLPSWSWLSIRGPIYEGIWTYFPPMRCADLVDSCIEWSGEALTSTLLNAKLRLRTKLIPFRDVFGEAVGDRFRDGHTEYSFDLKSFGSSESLVLMLLVCEGGYFRTSQNWNWKRPHFLIIERVGDSGQEYKRVGSGQSHIMGGTIDPFHVAEDVEITLI